MKHRNNKRPLRVHLTVGFMIFSLLLIAVLWLFQTVFLETFYRSVKTRQVKSCAASVSANLDADSLYDLIADIEEQNNMAVAIYDTDGTIFDTVYLSDRAPYMRSSLPMSTVYELYRQAACDPNNEYATITRTGLERRFELHAVSGQRTAGTEPNDGDQPSDSDDSDRDTDSLTQHNGGEKYLDITLRQPDLEREKVDTLAYARVISTDDGERLVVVESEITPVNSVIDTLRYQLIIMTAVILLVSVVMAVITARTISKPLSDTNEKAKSLARQDYDVTFEGGRYREIKELNNTLTYAAGELKKVDGLQKELIANISHDLRTPLTMITGYSEVMRDLPGEMTPENIQIIIDEATRLNSLVTDLLDISRLQSGTADIKSAPFSLTKCIESIFSRYTKLIENDGLNIVFEHEGEAFIMGDELRMTQVLYNLINNAINYIGEDKTVIVRQSVQDDRVRVDVIDHGEGIAPDKLAYIWDRYYRVDREHRRAKIGTGLGLSIVKNILLAHNADFGVASKPGEGSDFYFSLPVIPADYE